MSTFLEVGKNYICSNGKIAKVLIEDTDMSDEQGPCYLARIENFDDNFGYRYVGVRDLDDHGAVFNGLDASFNLKIKLNIEDMPYRGKYCLEDPTLLRGQPIGQYHCPACGILCLAGEEHPDYSLDNPDELLSFGFDGVWYRNKITNRICKILTLHRPESSHDFNVVYSYKDDNHVYSKPLDDFFECFVLRTRQGEVEVGEAFTKLSSGDTYIVLIVGNLSSNWTTVVGFRSLDSDEDYVRPLEEFLDKYVPKTDKLST